MCERKTGGEGEREIEREKEREREKEGVGGREGDFHLVVVRFS